MRSIFLTLFLFLSVAAVVKDARAFVAKQSTVSDMYQAGPALTGHVITKVHRVITPYQVVSRVTAPLYLDMAEALKNSLHADTWVPTRASFPAISAYYSPQDASRSFPDSALLHQAVFLNAIGEWLKTIFSAQTALATGDCFRAGGSPTPGPNLWAFCCDCDINGYPVGCLNLMCRAYPAAIYDYTTGVCGCG